MRLYVTVRVIAELVTPESEAVILVVPAVTPVASPPVEMVATLVSELAQFTFEVISAVEPSEYVPVAVNCCVKPVAKLSGRAGVMVMAERVGAGTTVMVTTGLVTPG